MTISAATDSTQGSASLYAVEPKVHPDVESGSEGCDTQTSTTEETSKAVCGHKHYSHRAPWLRALVLGANDGMVSTASLMLGVGAVEHSVKTMVVGGLAGLVAGACSMAIGEFVSVFSQRDAEKADVEKERQVRRPSYPPLLNVSVKTILMIASSIRMNLISTEWILRMVCLVMLRHTHPTDTCRNTCHHSTAKLSGT